MEMNKQKFLKFLISEIERQQKNMYKSGEGKKVVAVLTEIYTLASDGKFDVGRDVRDEINNVHSEHNNFGGVVHHAV
jgi:RAB protein geranylgeranyltransferase component A